MIIATITSLLILNQKLIRKGGRSGSSPDPSYSLLTEGFCKRSLGSTNMPSIIFSNGDTSKEVALSEVNSVEDVASNMKEVMTNEQKTTLEELSNSRD